MNPFPDCILYTNDEALRQRLTAFLEAEAQVQPVDSVEDLEAILSRAPYILVTLDLRQNDSAKLLPRFSQEWPRAVVIALGLARTEPMLAAEEYGVYAAEDIDADRKHIQGLFARALDYTRVLRQNEILREKAAGAGAAAAVESGLRRPANHNGLLPLQHFSRAFRYADNVQNLLNQIVEAIASAAMVPRAGIFARLRDSATFRFRSGLRCLESTQALEFKARDSLIRWMASNAHMISRSTLEYIGNEFERTLLEQALDAMGAEVILPLQSQQRLSGWLFVGHRSTGIPFKQEDLEELMVLADHVAVMLENALLHEEITVQKILAETLLHSLPTGIVTTDANGIIRWCNTVACQALDIAPERVMNQSVSMLGSQLADLIWRTLKGESFPEACELMEAGGRRHLSAQLRQLTDRDQCLGTVALIHDLTRERALLEKQANVDRLTFWNELAAAMSHEIRNPLVAISTFAQLLPERYADPEFRNDFRKVVAHEIDRLNGITEQINSFAHPPEPAFKELDLVHVLEKSVALAHQRETAFGGIPVALNTARNLPPLVGDERALQECFTHIIINALEATAKEKKPHIQVTADILHVNGKPAGIVIGVRDNGKGIPSDMLPKVFSPFCTTKARGMGLGLAIAQRTIFDHGGQIQLDSTKTGTGVTITLPRDGTTGKTRPVANESRQ